MAGIGGTSPLKGPKWLYLDLFDDFDDFDLFFGPFQARIFVILIAFLGGDRESKFTKPNSYSPVHAVPPGCCYAVTDVEALSSLKKLRTNQIKDSKNTNWTD